MLVLSHKEDDYLIPFLPDGSDIQILVAKLQGKSVKLGVEAPRDIIILRDQARKPYPAE